MRQLSVFPFSGYNSRRTHGNDLWRHFDEIFSSFADTAGDLTSSDSARIMNPPIDIEEEGDEFVLRVDVPGINKSDLKVEIRDGVLFISGERKKVTKREENEFGRYEREFGRFERAITLPRTVQHDKVDARYENGVLEVRVPKAADSAARLIEVKSNS